MESHPTLHGKHSVLSGSEFFGCLVQCIFVLLCLDPGIAGPFVEVRLSVSLSVRSAITQE